MYSWFQEFSVEDFAKSYQFTIQALIAIGTCGAVITSLRIARSNRRSFLNARIAIASAMIPTIQGTYQATGEKILSVTVQNVGVIPIYLSGSAYEWHFPWPTQIRSQQWPPGAKPIALMPGKSETILLAKGLTEIAEVIESLRESNKVPKLLVSLVRFRIIADDGRIFRAKLNRKTVASLMKSLSPKNV